MSEDVGYGDYAPAQNLCRNDCGYAVDRIFGMYECPQKSCSESAEKETQDIRDYHDCRCKLYLQPFLHADYEGQSHRQDGEEQFVGYSCKTAAQGCYGMKQCKNMYDPA